jgi:hypothetical protein
MVRAAGVEPNLSNTVHKGTTQTVAHCTPTYYTNDRMSNKLVAVGGLITTGYCNVFPRT